MRLVFREQLVARHIFVQVADAHSSGAQRNEKQREKYDDVFAKCSLSEPWFFFLFSFQFWLINKRNAYDRLAGSGSNIFKSHLVAL